MQRAELVDFNSTNNNIIQQLRMITRYPYIISEKVRLACSKTVEEAVTHPLLEVRMAGVALSATLQKVNLGVFKQLASDQVQRHLSFDKQVDAGEAQRKKALESMSNEQLAALSALAESMGGAIDLDGIKQ